ncbi:outer membrane protein [Orrella marina]|uniref:Outer membrane protein beta-barrel domain-containing protein n=1 Tax=Orrella marina TaxID=2163011 RepID=A0A2R4XHZ1_9BURK|nr:outer membrane beta-barrel protein [Orrella marina]AWB33436.1 hypothetical protein DBV39_06635 [Orrella marina]
MIANNRSRLLSCVPWLQRQPQLFLRCALSVLVLGVISLPISAQGLGSASASTGQSRAQSGFYLGVLGGTGSLADTSLQQRGGVYLTSRRILPIDAQGSTGHTGVWLTGIQAGYEGNPVGLSGQDWALRPALEAEGILIGQHSPVGNMPIMPRFLGTQYVKMPMTAQLLMANAVLTIRTPYSDTVFPYIGAGAGAAFISISGADSANPSEPGINHFNSDPNARATAFAAQFKVGLRAQLQSNLAWFAEYRLISINPTSYTFGSTVYPGAHLPTKPWSVNMGRLNYNLFVTGLQYRF